MATLTDLAKAVARQEGNTFGNNPGNLRYNGQYGATKGANGFAVFATPELGWMALERQIALDASRGHTLSSFLAKYAPASENDTGTYIANVSSWTGIQPTDKLQEVLERDAVEDFFDYGPSADWFTSSLGAEVLGFPLWAWLAAGALGLVVMVIRKTR